MRFAMIFSAGLGSAAVLASTLAMAATSGNSPGAMLAAMSTLEDRAKGSDRFCAREDTARTGVLANGFRYLILSSQMEPGQARVILDVLAGTQHEDADQVDAAHLVEHLLLLYFTAPDGSRMAQLSDYNRSGPYARAPTPLDIGVGGSPQDVYTPYGGTIDVQQLPAMIERLRQLAQGAAMEPSEFELHRRIILSERRSSAVDPRLDELARGWAGGEMQDLSSKSLRRGIRKLNFDAVMRYYSAWYRPDREILYVVGDVDPDSVERAILAAFSPLGLAQDTVESKQAASKAVRSLVVRSKQSKVDHLELFFEDVAIGDQRKLWQLYILREIINARLERARMAGIVPISRVGIQAVDASNASRQRDAFYPSLYWSDLFGIQLSYRTSPENSSSAARYIWKVMQDIADNGPSDQELSAAKAAMTKGYPFQSQTSLRDITDNLGAAARRCGLGKRIFEAKLPDKAELDSFDSPSVRERLERITQPENIRFALLRAKQAPVRRIERFQDMLEAPDHPIPSPRTFALPKVAGGAASPVRLPVKMETLLQPNGATLANMFGGPKIYLVEREGKPFRAQISSGLRSIRAEDLCRIPVIDRAMQLETQRQKNAAGGRMPTGVARLWPARRLTLTTNSPPQEARPALMALIDAMSTPDISVAAYAQAKIDYENGDVPLLRARDLWRIIASADELPSKIDLSDCPMPDGGEMLETWRRLYSPSTDTVITISGTFDRSQVLSALAERHADLALPRVRDVTATLTEAQRSYHITGVPELEHEVSVTLTADGFQRNRESFAFLKAIAPILNDRLSVRLRDIEGLAYFTESQVDLGYDGRAFFNVSIWGDKRDLPLVRGLIEQELTIAARDGLTQSELAAFTEAWLKETHASVDVVQQMENGFLPESSAAALVQPNSAQISETLQRFTQSRSTAFSVSPIDEY